MNANAASESRHPHFRFRTCAHLSHLFFNKGEELKDRWMGLIQEQVVKDTQNNPTSLQLDVCHWVSQATFDVIGLAGAFLPSVCITPPA